MRIVKPLVIEMFSQEHNDARGSLDHWYRLTKAGKWRNTADVKAVFGNLVDFVANNRAIFNIKGNSYRLIVEINFHSQAVFIRFLGTHKEYDKVDASTVKKY